MYRIVEKRRKFYIQQITKLGWSYVVKRYWSDKNYNNEYSTKYLYGFILILLLIITILLAVLNYKLLFFISLNLTIIYTIAYSNYYIGIERVLYDNLKDANNSINIIKEDEKIFKEKVKYHYTDLKSERYDKLKSLQ